MKQKIALILVILISLSFLSSTDAYIVLTWQSQRSTNWCAEASLSMVLSYWNVNVSQIEISNYIHDVLHYPDPTVYGTPPSAMVLYAESQGFNATVFFGNNSIEDMEPFISKGIPLIVFQWGDIFHTTGHARVVVGFDYGLVSSISNKTAQNVLTNYVVTYDSGTGYYDGINHVFKPYNISYSEFTDLWTYNRNWTLAIQPYPYITPSPTASPSPTLTPIPSPNPTQTPIATISPTQTPTPTQTPIPTTKPTDKPLSTPIPEPTKEPITEIIKEPIPEQITETQNNTVIEPTSTPISTQIEIPISTPIETPISTAIPTATPTEIKEIPEFNNNIWIIAIILAVSTIIIYKKARMQTNIKIS